MISRIHGRLGTAGLVVAIVALVAALAGGAYAASGALTGKQKKEVEKIAKKYAGKPGATGPKGDTGSAGAAGTAGKQGDRGPQGERGPQGDQGVAGKNGKDGVLWTAGGTLPAEATETGSWTFGDIPEGSAPPGNVRIAISFPIPLAAPLTSTFGACTSNPATSACHTHYINFNNQEVLEGDVVSATPSAFCKGTVEAPSAEPGHLCIYTAELSKAKTSNVGFVRTDQELETLGAGTTGAALRFRAIQEGAAGWGTWAVTAPEE